METESLFAKLATFFERALRPNEVKEIANYEDGKLLLIRDDVGKPRYSLVFDSRALGTHHNTLNSFIEWIEYQNVITQEIALWCNESGVQAQYDKKGINPPGDILSLTKTHAFKAVRSIEDNTANGAFFQPSALWSLLVSKLADAGTGVEELTLQLSEITINVKATAKEDIGKIGIRQNSSQSATLSIAYGGGKTDLPTTIRFNVQVWNEVPDLIVPVRGRIEARADEKNGLTIGIHIEDLDALLLRALDTLREQIATRLPKNSIFCGRTILNEVYRHTE